MIPVPPSQIQASPVVGRKLLGRLGADWSGKCETWSWCQPISAGLCRHRGDGIGSFIAWGDSHVGVVSAPSTGNATVEGAGPGGEYGGGTASAAGADDRGLATRYGPGMMNYVATSRMVNGGETRKYGDDRYWPACRST